MITQGTSRFPWESPLRFRDEKASRSVPPSEFDTFCNFAFGFLEEQSVRYLVIGGLAVVVVGEPRTTADADAIVFVSPEQCEELIRQASESGFDLQEEVETARLRETGTVRFRKGRFQIDLITASLPFEDVALQRAHRHKLFGLHLPFPTPEDLLLFKILAGRDKDLLDAEGIVRRHAARLDTEYLQNTLRSICEMAEDMTPLNRLGKVFSRANLDPSE